MNKKVIAAIALCAVTLTSCGKKTNDFRGVNWDASQKAVERSEDKAYTFATSELMIFDGEINGEPIETYYLFVDNKLSEGQCKFVIGDRTLDELIVSYQSLSAQLIEKYGQPKNPDYRVWTNYDEKYVADKDNVNIYNHRLEYKLEWETKTSNISLSLNYKDEQVNYVYYASRLPENS